MITPIESKIVKCSLKDFFLYFLHLGAFGFGGPIALSGYMQRDLVEKKRWISKEDYVDGLALAQLAPGPLAAQLAMYLGWVRAGVWGATIVSIAFILPSFLMVLVISAFYLCFGGLDWMQGVFYGIGAAVIVIIVRSSYKLVKLTLAKDWALWAIFLINAVVTGWTESEIIWLFLLSGVASLLIKAPPKFSKKIATFVLCPPWLMQGLHGVVPAHTLWKVLVYFATAGTFVFGSGLAIVPFMHGGVVNQYQWLTERQFLDAIAVAMITPGPVVITVAFVGYLVAGPLGAVAASIGIFLPTYLFVVIPAPFYKRYAKNLRIKAFVGGITASATGAIAGAAFVLGKRAIIDIPTVLIAVVTFAILFKTKKIPEPIVILLAGLAGLLLFHKS
jgi:chromate transporter